MVLAVNIFKKTWSQDKRKLGEFTHVGILLQISQPEGGGGGGRVLPKILDRMWFLNPYPI